MDYMYLVHEIDNEIIVEKYGIGLQTYKNIIERVLYLLQFNDKISVYQVTYILNKYDCYEWINKGIFTETFYNLAYYSANMDIPTLKKRIFEIKLLHTYENTYICNPLAIIKKDKYIYDYVLYNYMKNITNSKITHPLLDIFPNQTLIAHKFYSE